MIPRGVPYDEAMRRFRWNVPQKFNLGRAVCERHEPKTLALIVLTSGSAIAPFIYTLF